MKRVFALATLLALVAAIPARGDESICLNSIDMSKLRTAVASYAGIYADLTDRIHCSKPTATQKRICENDVLRFMEKLDHMATAYAYENATKREVDRNKAIGTDWLNKMLKKCKTTECICQAYKVSAEDALGGNSPYYLPED